MIILFSAVAAFARLRVNDPQFRAVGVRDDAAPKNATSSHGGGAIPSPDDPPSEPGDDNHVAVRWSPSCNGLSAWTGVVGVNITESEVMASADEGLTLCYGSAAPNPSSNNDTSDLQKSESDDREVSTIGMFNILHESVRIGMGLPVNGTVANHFGKYKFYDLGSGSGKFVVYSVLAGFKRATGIELDRTQVKLSTSKLKRFSKLFPCVKDRLVLVKGSVVSNASAWWAGTEPRVIFTDATGLDKLWPQISHLFSSSDLGKDTVVAVIGRSRLGIAEDRGELKVPLGSFPHPNTETVHFFTNGDMKKMMSENGYEDEEEADRHANITRNTNRTPSNLKRHGKAEGRIPPKEDPYTPK